MTIHLTGADTYRSARRLAELRSAFVAKHDPRGFNTVTLDGATTSLEELRTAVTTTGFFAAKRFVALDRYAPDGPLKPDRLSSLLEPVAAKDSDVVVVIRDLLAEPERSAKRPAAGSRAKTTGRTAPGQLVLPKEKRETFAQLTAAQAVAWLGREAQAQAGLLDPAAAQRLVALCNRDSWRMATELEKLLAYAAGRVVTVADVDAMVKSEYASDIFALTDALGQRQTARALELLHRELSAGSNEFALIATLASHVRNLWQVQRTKERGLSPAAIAAELNLHPYVVQKALAQTSHFRPAELRDLHHRLLEIDHDLKTSPLDAETLLDLILIER
mgnify:FL=1